MKNIAVINDLSGVGRCSLAVQLPVISAMGVEARPLPTSILSNHTGFAEQTIVDFSKHTKDILDMWEKNNFTFDGALSGYLGSCEQASFILDFVQKEKAQNENFKYILDPVMADNGKLYNGLTESHVDAMRKLMKHADVSCPNLTEACLIGDFDYDGMKETLDTLESDAGRLMVIHSLFSELTHMTDGTIVVTGIEAGSELVNAVCEPGRDIYFVKKEKVGEGRPGTGDIFSAIFAAGYVKTGDIKESLETATQFIKDVLQNSDNQKTDKMYGVQFEDQLYKLCK